MPMESQVVCVTKNLGGILQNVFLQFTYLAKYHQYYSIVEATHLARNKTLHIQRLLQLLDWSITAASSNKWNQSQ